MYQEYHIHVLYHLLAVSYFCLSVIKTHWLQTDFCSWWMNKEAWPGSQYSLPWQIRTCSCMTQLPGVRRNGPLHSKATHFLPQGTVYIVHTVQNMITRMWIVKHAYTEVPDVKQIWYVMNVIFLNIWYSKFIIQFQTIWNDTDFAVNINLLSVCWL